MELMAVIQKNLLKNNVLILCRLEFLNITEYRGERMIKIPVFKILFAAKVNLLIDLIIMLQFIK